MGHSHWGQVHVAGYLSGQAMPLSLSTTYNPATVERPGPTQLDLAGHGVAWPRPFPPPGFMCCPGENLPEMRAG